MQEASDKFFSRLGKKRPTKSNYFAERTESEQRKLVKFASQSYPIVHEDVLKEAEKFLEENKEKHSIYASMNLLDFFDRLIKKRPLVFIGAQDDWMDKYGTKGSGDWDRKARNDIENFLTYREQKLSALIQLSTETLLINTGGRYNKGQAAPEGSFIKEAVYVGVVGARFEKPGKMDHQDCVISQHSESWGRQQSRFKFEQIGHSDLFFNVTLYKNRMRLSFETFLLEANRRGQQQKKNIYCHVVGLGLGVWQLQGYQNQTKHFFDAFEESLDNLLENSNIDHLSDVDFSWVDPPVDAVFKHLHKFKDSNVLIHISRRDPFAKHEREKVNNLL